MIVKAYAKLNLFLNVVKKRRDGYHILNMVTHPIDLYDELMFELSEKDEVIGSSFDDEIIMKVIRKIKTVFNVKECVKVTLKKNIPVGAGLGGGSADAAATLKALNKMFELGLSLDELAEIGITIGADVPMCIYNKPSIVKGIGEIEEFVEGSDKFVLLVVPGEKMNTKEVFSNVGEDFLSFKDSSELIKALHRESANNIHKHMTNDLEDVTLSISREIKSIRKTIRKINYNFTMTGSGTVFFALYDDLFEMEKDAKELDNKGINYIFSQLLLNL